ncbi:MAG TPA: AAA family ATPase [Candidatus Nanopelagicales bacterium]|nr:AAA family ATPase [Candidatus Nanopelagicales bacterium]
MANPAASGRLRPEAGAPVRTMPDKFPVPIGIDDFRTVRERGLWYVDKSHLIAGLLDRQGASVVLLPRPRRFGKTINLSMLRCFFEKLPEDLSHLFEGLCVWDAGEAYRAHFQRYPVISLTFKDTRHQRFEGCWEAIQKKIQVLFREHQAVLGDGTLDPWEARDYQAVLDGTAGRVLYERALLDLSGYLRRRHGEPVVILIDEYEEPIHAGYLNGYAREIIDFYGPFLTEGLKGNPHLFKAVLTGILRVARESIFSGLNNLRVYSLLRPEFSTCFGFTEAEVTGLLEKAGRQDRLDLVRDYYNGYVFGGQVAYNPWSVLSYLDDESGMLRSHWLSTSGNELIRELLARHAFSDGEM